MELLYGLVAVASIVLFAVEAIISQRLTRANKLLRELNSSQSDRLAVLELDCQRAHEWIVEHQTVQT